MANPSRKQKVAPRLNEPTLKAAAVKTLIKSIERVHETTDRKLQEIAYFCKDKKCNE
jgi:hypothetical protein